MVVDVEVAKDQQVGIHGGKKGGRGDGPAGGGASYRAICVDDPEKIVGGIKEPARGVEVYGHDVGSAEVDRKQGNCS